MMSTLYIATGLSLVGVAQWLNNTYAPMTSSIKTIHNIVAVVAVWVPRAFGPSANVGSLRF